MRRLISKVVLVLSISAMPVVAFADGEYGMAGCGLGSIIFGDGGGQITAATTNNIVWPVQPIGITIGTSNCNPTGGDYGMLEQSKFVVANLATLSKEMAQGQGETLAGLAKLMGCSDESMAQFGTLTQRNYGEIMASPGAVAIVETLRGEMQGDEQLARSCSRI